MNRKLLHAACLGVGLLMAGDIGAQALGDVEKKAKLTDAERAKRDAEKVYQWIKFHAEKSPPLRAEPNKSEPKPEIKGSRASAAARSAQAVAPAPAPQTAVAAPAASAPASEATGVAAAPPSAVSAELPRPAPQLAAAPAPEVQLQLLKRVEPEYPRQLITTQRSGVVALRFTVLPSGEVDQPEVTASPHRRLSTAALDAVRQWRFAPIPVARTVAVEVGFRLE
ncbi:energy transducer TonB [Roseateles sp. BYS180W]|uniref:Energy transducer TonB n=1 Tax=Roseateles rivi TaxID=3299028 RepID=A0ABW7FWU6_9BURK